MRAHCEALAAQGSLIERRGRFTLRAPEDFPAARVSLRSGSPQSVQIVDAQQGELLGDVELARACSTVHDGAVYLHMGRQYEVRELDLEARRAIVEPFKGDWYTQPKREIDTLRRAAARPPRVLRRDAVSFGTVTVSEQVLAFQRKRLGTREVLGIEALDLPQTEYTTQALWYELVRRGRSADLPLEVLLGSLHATEHAQIAVLPLLAMCDRWDIGGLSTNLHPQTGGPTIFIYDGHPGGVGITRQGFLRFEELARDAQRADRRVPVRGRLPVMRAVAEVRQPQRAAAQGRRAGAARRDARGELSRGASGTAARIDSPAHAFLATCPASESGRNCACWCSLAVRKLCTARRRVAGSVLFAEKEGDGAAPPRHHRLPF